MSQPLNIAFIGNQIAFGGGATSFYLLVKSLKDKPINKFVFASEIRSLEMKQNFKKYCEVVEQINISEVKSSQTSKTSNYRYLKAKKKIKEEVGRITLLIEKYNIDVIHFNNSVFSHLYEEILKKSDVKIVTHVREMILSNKGKVPDLIVDNIAKFSWKIITISDNEMKPFSNSDHVIPIANPFDFSKIAHPFLNLRGEWSVKDDAIIIGMIGRFAKSKGHMLFLEAAKLLIDENKGISIKFVIAGVAKRKPLWKRILKRLLFRTDFGDIVLSFMRKNDLYKHVILIPYTKSIFNVINTFDIVVRPSLFGDPWGRDIIESMAFGKPIIATGTSEFYVENKVNGFLIQPSPAALAERIKYCINDPKVLDSMRELNKIKINKMCSIKEYGDNVFNFYMS